MGENNNIIGLSFDDKSVKSTRNDNMTVLSVVSYFRSDKLNKFMNTIGFVNLSDVVIDTLKSYGYTYDYKLNGWATKTIGIVNLDERDTDNQKMADRIALSKAKAKAYSRAMRCFNTITTKFANALILFDDSQMKLKTYYDDEIEALDRVIKTGYCKPNK